MKGEAFHLSIESFILGSLHRFNFFWDGPIKLDHDQKKKRIKKVGLVSHPQLINMKQNKYLTLLGEVFLGRAISPGQK
jgi:hypothetical protein